MPRPKAKAKKIPKKNKTICPFADPKCKICQLPFKDLQRVHDLKFVEKKTVKEIVDFLKNVHGFGKNNSLVTKHFKKHVSNIDQKAKEATKALVAEVLPPLAPNQPDVQRGEQLEKAYSEITRMAADFTAVAGILSEQLNIRLRDAKKFDEETKDWTIEKLINVVAIVNKEARSQIKDVSMLGAPKVLVSRFLESTMKQMMQEASQIYVDTCGGLQNSILQSLEDNQIAANVLSDEVFALIFSSVAKTYKERMESLMQEQLAKADEALAELERIV